MQPNSPPYQRAARAGFNHSGQGFSLVRGTREIQNGQTYGLFTRHEVQNYTRGEIRFPPIPEVDRWFGVEPNKSQAQLTSNMKQWLQPVKATLAQLAKGTQEARSSLGRGARRRSRGSSAPLRVTRRHQVERKHAVALRDLPRHTVIEAPQALRAARERLEQGDLANANRLYEALMAPLRGTERARAVQDQLAERD